MTRQKFALLPPPSEERLTVCDSRKLAHVVKVKHDECVFDRYKVWTMEYMDRLEMKKVFDLQIAVTAAMFGEQRPKFQ